MVEPPVGADGRKGTAAFRVPDPTLRDYLRVVSTRRLMVLSVFLMVVALAGAWVFTQTPIYRPKAVLQITPSRSTVTPFQGPFDPGALASVGKHQFVETQMQLILKDDLVDATFSHFGVAGKPAFKNAEDPREKFRRLFSVRPVRGTFLVEVTFDWPDPRLGAKILDNHVERYVQDYEGRHRRATDESVEKLRDQRKEYAPRVEAARRALQDFKEEHNMVAFDQVHDTIADDLMARSKAVSEARGKLSEMKTRLEQVERAVKNRTAVDDLPDVLESTLIRDYRNQRSQCEQNLREGLKRFGENHPEIKALRAKLDTITENIQIEIDRVVSSIRTEHATADTLLQLRLTELTQQEKEVQKFNKLKLQYDALRAQFETQEQIYTAVMKRIDQLQISKTADSGAATITIETRPKAEKLAAKPRKKLIMALACVLGLALGAGLAFLFDSLDTTIKSKDDVGRHLGLNLLGYVPEIPELRGAKRKHSGAALAMLRHPRSAVAESFRSIRTALSFSVAAKDVRHIMVTSASPSEGKTLVSVNTAAAMAQTGKRVLLVDADMRKPAVHKVFEVEQTPGLTNLLVGEGATELSDVVRATSVPNLSFIPCGPIPPNPAELIGSERMTSLLDKMTAEYDRVIIDTPPVVNVTDAAVLCGVAHGVVLVVRSFRTQRELARRAVELLANSGGRLLGTVLNNLDVPRGAYAYDSYYYYQQYYYYAEDGSKKKRKRRKKREKRRPEDQDSQRATA